MREVDVEAATFAVVVATTISSFVSITGAVFLAVPAIVLDRGAAAFLMIYLWPVSGLVLVAILLVSFGLGFYIARIARNRLTNRLAYAARWFVPLSAALLLAPVAVVGALAYRPASKDPNPPAPLAIGAYKEFDQRVKKKFPVGSLENDMATELQREGFVTDSASSPVIEHMAVLHDQRFPCDSTFFVRWRGDGNGRLTEIKGDFQATCL
jgi:hypothetical protein